MKDINMSEMDCVYGGADVSPYPQEAQTAGDYAGRVGRVIDGFLSIFQINTDFSLALTWITRGLISILKDPLAEGEWSKLGRAELRGGILYIINGFKIYT